MGHRRVAVAGLAGLALSSSVAASHAFIALPGPAAGPRILPLRQQFVPARLRCGSALSCAPSASRMSGTYNVQEASCGSTLQQPQHQPLAVGDAAQTPIFKGWRGHALKLAKRAGSASLMLLGLLVVAATPAAAHASSTFADLSLAATTSFNGVMAKLAASGFLQAFSLVFVSEIGDKTFFIAGLLAMKTSRLISFSGSMAALTVMTVISVVIGQIFHAIPAGLAGGFKFDQLVAVLAFAYFGVKTLKDAYDMPDGDMSGVEEEMAEAEKAVEESKAQAQKTTWGSILQIFSLVFAAEFGDRSFLSTIALGAAQNPVSVATGAIAAHSTATGIAVASGAFLSKYFSEKLIGYIGGSLFVLFAITTALGIF